MSTSPRGTALVTGASGFVGRRLVPRLLDEGWQVTVLVRDPSALDGEPWLDDVVVRRGSVDDPDALTGALTGVTAAYYLVHSMSSTYEFAARDLDLARRFAAAADEAGLARIVYLGGLLPHDEPLTPHLASRREVGQVFLDSPVPAAVLQAGIVIGSGSASFDLLELAVRLPVVIGPTWLDNRVQPIAVEDALHVLVGAASLPPEVDRAFDIGGPDALSYTDLLRAFAEVVGRRLPIVLTVPILLPRTASFWAGLLAPGSSSLNAALVHSLTVDMVCHEHDIDSYVVPRGGGALDVRAAIKEALEHPLTGRQVGRTA